MCRTALAHLCWLPYAATLARPLSGRRPLPLVLAADTQAPVAHLMDGVPTMAVLLAETARAMGPEEGAYHAAGPADAEGFLARAVDEIIVHTGDIAEAWG